MNLQESIRRILREELNNRGETELPNIKLTTYIVRFDTDEDSEIELVTTDFEDAKYRYDSTTKGDYINGSFSVSLDKKIDIYKFVYELDEDESIEDYPIEEYYKDLYFYELIDEGEFEIIENRVVESYNYTSNDLLNDVENWAKNKFGNYKYNRIDVYSEDDDNEENEPIGSIQLRISDHSQNEDNLPYGIDESLSVVIANKDTTRGRFQQNKLQIYFSGDDSFEYIISQIEENLQELKENIIENKRNEFAKGGRTIAQTPAPKKDQIKGVKIDNKIGKEFWFEYHCYESPESCDAEIWYRSHQKVKVIGVSEWSYDDKEWRQEDGNPRVYLVEWIDGYQYDVFEDELFESPNEFYRPDPPKRKIQESIRILRKELNEIRVPRDERVELYKDDNIIVVVPLTHRALQKYAHRCQWCINDDKGEWEDYHKGLHAIIIQRKPKKNKKGITGMETEGEIYLLSRLDDGGWDWKTVTQTLGYDFGGSKEKALDYFVEISNDINNFNLNIVYYSPENGIYDMEDNFLWNYGYEISDIPNVTDEVIKIMDDYLQEE